MSDVTSVTLARYLAGECSPYEREEIRRWIEADPTRRKMVVMLEATWRRPSTHRPTLDVDMFWDGIAARLDHVPGRLAQVTPPGGPILERMPLKRKSWWPWRLGAAAVAAGLLIAAPWARTAIETIATRSYASEIREIATRRGERAQVLLADGSRVLLGPESKLRFARDIVGRQRDVDLDGEAYFTVIHDEQRPFRVRTAGSVTEDLGTEFVVRQYSADSTVLVAVVSGRVALAAVKDTQPKTKAASTLMLTAGAVGRIDADGHPVIDHNASVETYLAWTTGELRFHRTPLDVVAHELGRWYNVDVRLGDSSLATRTVTARFKDQSADAVLQSLATVLQLTVQRTGTSVTLLPLRRLP